MSLILRWWPMNLFLYWNFRYNLLVTIMLEGAEYPDPLHYHNHISHNPPPHHIWYPTYTQEEHFLHLYPSLTDSDKINVKVIGDTMVSGSLMGTVDSIGVFSPQTSFMACYSAWGVLTPPPPHLFPRKDLSSFTSAIKTLPSILHWLDWPAVQRNIMRKRLLWRRLGKLLR